MFKAAFTGRSEVPSGSASGRAKDESRRKKSSHSNRAESVISSSTRRDDDKDRERRRRDRPSSMHDDASTTSRYQDAYGSPGTSVYGTAPSSRNGEPRALTESALRMLADDDEWVDEDKDKDTRSEKKSRRKEGEEDKKRRSTRSEKERSRSRSRERKEKRKESKTTSSSEKVRDKDKDRKSRTAELVTESSRAIPEMGSFAQFPGQYSGGVMGPPQQQDASMMSGALPGSATQQQFPGQDYPQSSPARLGVGRADSWGAAAEYYLDEGQSVGYQPGNRPFTPNMLANPDSHLVAASAQAAPAQDTGHGSAADFYSGKISPVPFSSAPTTPAKPTKTGKQSSSSAGKPSKPNRTSSLGATAAALAAAGGAALAHRHSSSQQAGGISSNQKQSSSSSKLNQQTRHNSDGSVYYSAPSNNTYPPTLASTNGFGPSPRTIPGASHQKSANSNIPLYAAGATAAAAGLAGYEYSQHNHYNGQTNTSYSMAGGGGFGGNGQGPPRAPPGGMGGYGQYPSGGYDTGMQQHHHSEHKGPMTRLKDGFFNLISSPEDTAKMEMYTEYIGVCKHCFDPRTSAWDAPRVHHYHKRRDSFEDLRRRRSYEKMGRKISNDSLRRQGSVRVDKDNRYYASDSSRRRREGNGVGVVGAGLAAAGVAAGANALFNDRKNFDDTYSVKSGHRESSAVRRRSRSSSREQRRQSSYGVIRSDKKDYVSVRTNDGRKTVSRKSRSSSRDRKSFSLGTAAAGAAIGATALAASSRRRSKSRSRSRSPSVLNGAYGMSNSRSQRDRRSSRRSEEEESTGFFGTFFSPPRKKSQSSREHQKRRRGFFTFSNGSSSSSNSDLAFGDAISSRTNLPLRRKASTASNRSGRRTSRRKSDEHIAATVAGLGATAAALAAAQRGHRISKRTSRPELGKRRDVRHYTEPHSDDDEWEDELPSDVDDESSVDGGLAFGDYQGRRLSSRQSLESIGSQSSAGGLSAWGWRWGGKDRRRRDRRTATAQQTHFGPSTSLAGAAAVGLAGATISSVLQDQQHQANRPVLLDDAGRRLPSVDSFSTSTIPQGPMQHVDPRPISDVGSTSTSRHASIPGAFDQDPPFARPGPVPIQQPQPIAPGKASFTQSPTQMEVSDPYRPAQPRRANSSPTRGHFAQDAALIGGAALATAGILAGASAVGKRSRESSNVRFGLTEEQQRKEDRERDRASAEERRRADRTRALKEEAERVAREAREQDVRRAREEQNRKAAEAQLASQREAEQKARREAQELQERKRSEQEALERREAEAKRLERQRALEEAQRERERLEREARDRQMAAAAASAEVERHRLAREEAERQAELWERERRGREDAARDEDSRRKIGVEQQDRFTRDQSQRFEKDSKHNESTQSMPWGTIATGAAAAATVGAAMAGKEHANSRDRRSRPDSYYDDAKSDQQSPRYSGDWGAKESYGAKWEASKQAEIEDRARERYGPNKASVDIRDDYVAAEIKPKNEHEGEPLMDDDIMDPNYFNRRHTPAENARYAEFARKAAEKVVSADKVVSDREGAYKDQSTNYADFFAPKDLLSKGAEGKTRSVSPDPDNVVQVWHSRDAEIRSHFSPSDYGYGRSKHAPYGVPRLNVIAPTPPPGSGTTTPERRASKGSASSSPLSKTPGTEAEIVDRVADSKSKPERSRSISWGEDKTHIYDVQTPESYQDRDSYITSPEAKTAGAAAGIAIAATAGAALHEITVEGPDGGRTTYTEDEWLRQEKESKVTGAAEDEEIEDVTPEPQPGLQGFYRQPFFDSVSDMGTGIFDIDSPGTEGAPPQKGFVEGETDEPTPDDEKTPHIPGGFDDEMTDIFRPAPERKQDVDTRNTRSEEDAMVGASRGAEADDTSMWEPPLSKKEKKKREKAAKRASNSAENEVESSQGKSSTFAKLSRSDDTEAPADYFPNMTNDKTRGDEKLTSVADVATPIANGSKAKSESEKPIPSSTSSEPPLSKKEQKKKDKAARKQGFAEIADNILASGGIAAAAAAATAVESNEDSSSSSSRKKKSKKSKLGEPLDRDPRDLEFVPDPSVVEPEKTGMPGGWDSEVPPQQDSRNDENDANPFQYQVAADDTAAPAEEAESRDIDPSAEWSETPKRSKKKGKRSSIAFNLPDVSSPLRSEIPIEEPLSQASATRATNGDNALADVTNGNKNSEILHSTQRPTALDHGGIQAETYEDEGLFENGNGVTESPRAMSPDDTKSVASAPTPDYEGSRGSRHRDSRRESDYFDEPSYAYETQSGAASEPRDGPGSSKKSKRRSRLADDDDTASVTSSRSRRERERDDSSSSKKDKKGGLFGLFGRKSNEDSKSSKEKDKYDDASLSRESARDRKSSRDDDDDEGSRRRKKKHRDSDYGDDDDDSRSVKSESRRRRSTKDDYDDRTSPARSEPSGRHHRRRRTDDGGEELSRKDSQESRSAVSENGHRNHRHHHRSDEDTYETSSRDQSFLGMRVGDLPPLPDSRPASPDLAAAKQEQGHGSPAMTISDAGLVRLREADAQDEHDMIEADRDAQNDVLGTQDPGMETPIRPSAVQRPLSATTVPLRFPFGTAPQTPGSLKERTQSFSSPVASASSPISPISGKQTRQGRPHSTEFRPLYLVERNRKTPEVEDVLPSLPSSKPSSRASSIHGSDDNYHSAAEEFERDLADRGHKLTLDIGDATAYHPDDMLDSQEATPKASEFPNTVQSKPPKQEPQFYTWEDFARDERMHVEGQSRDPNRDREGYSAELEEPTFARSRSKSPSKHTSDFKTVAAAAMLGTAAVYAHHRSQGSSPDRPSDSRREHLSVGDGEEGRDSSYTFPLPAPVEQMTTSRDIAAAASTVHPRPATGQVTIEPTSDQPAVPTGSYRDNASDGFVAVEQAVEEGAAFLPSTAAHSMPSRAWRYPYTIAETSTTASGTAFQRRANDLSDPASEPRHESYTIPSTVAHTTPLLPSAGYAAEPDASTTDHADDISTDPVKNTAREVQDLNDGPAFLPSAAAHTMLYHTRPSRPASFSEDNEDSFVDAVEGIGTADALNHANAAVDVSSITDENSVPYAVPSAKADPAPLVIEQRSVEVGQDGPSEMPTAPKLTRKQSKKAKKKQKAAALMKDEDEPDVQPAISFDGVEGEKAQDDTGKPIDDHNRGSPTIEGSAIRNSVDAEFVQHSPGSSRVAAPSTLGLHDFNRVAHSSYLPWQDAQSQAFGDAMSRSISPLPADIHEVSASDLPRPSMAESHADETSPLLGRQVDQVDDESRLPATAADAGLAAIAGIGIAAVATEYPESPSSKRTNKKDKKRKSATWSDLDPETQAVSSGAIDESLQTEPHPELERSQSVTDAGVEKETIFLTGGKRSEDLSSVPSAKKGKKGKKTRHSSLADSETNIEPTSWSTSQREPLDDESTTNTNATSADIDDPDENIVVSEPPTASITRSEPEAATDSFPNVSRKQSKKDKKKKKALASFDADDNDAQDTSSPRQMSIDDSSFADSSGPAAVGADKHQVTAAATESFAPVTKKKSKKDKKNNRQTVDWGQAEPESFGSANEDTNAQDEMSRGEETEPTVPDDGGPVEEVSHLIRESHGVVPVSVKEENSIPRDDAESPAHSNGAIVDDSLEGDQEDKEAPSEDLPTQPTLSRKQSKKDKKKKKLLFQLWEANVEGNLPAAVLVAEPETYVSSPQQTAVASTPRDLGWNAEDIPLPDVEEDEILSLRESSDQQSAKQEVARKQDEEEHAWDESLDEASRGNGVQSHSGSRDVQATAQFVSRDVSETRGLSSEPLSTNESTLAEADQQLRGEGSIEPVDDDEMQAKSFEQASDEFWPVSTSKKSKKKGKKGKKVSSGLATPIMHEAEFLTATQFEQSEERATNAADKLTTTLQHLSGPEKEIDDAEPKSQPEEVTEQVGAGEHIMVNTSNTQDDEIPSNVIPNLPADGVPPLMNMDEPAEAEHPEIPSLEESQEQNSKDPTFADIWADEDLVTQEKDDMVHDLLEDPIGENAPNLSFPSKKSKKNKGKRGSVVEDASMGQAEEQSPMMTDRIADQDVMPVVASDATKAIEVGLDDATPTGDIWSPPAAAKRKGKTRKQSSETSMSDKPPETTSELVDGASQIEENRVSSEPADHIARSDLTDGSAIGSDSKTQIDTTDTIPGAWFEISEAGQLEGTQLVDDKEHRSSLEHVSNELPSVHNAVSAEVEDVWTPPTGKKKGRKGKKTRQSTLGGVDADEGAPSASQLEDEPPAPETNDLSKHVPSPPQEDAGPNFNNVWEAPTKSKKGKKTKRDKQTFSWADEPSEEPEAIHMIQDEEITSEPTATEDLSMDARSTQSLPDALEQNVNSKGAAATRATDVGATTNLPPLELDDRTRSVPIASADGSPQNQIILQEAANEQGADAAKPAMEGVPGPIAVPNNEPEFVLKKAKKGKKGKKSRESTFDPWTETSNEPGTSTNVPSAAHDDLVSTATTAVLAATTGVALGEVSKNMTEDDTWSGFSSKKPKKQSKKTKKSESVTPAIDQDQAFETEGSDSIQRIEEAGINMGRDNPIEAGQSSIEWPENELIQDYALDSRKQEVPENEAVTNSEIEEETQSVTQNQPHYQEVEFSETAFVDEYSKSPAGMDVNMQPLNGIDTHAADVALPEESPDEHDALRETERHSEPHKMSPHRAEEAEATVPSTHLPSYDIDFAATLAAGLADTGFDPDLVINDPVFQRRASPPGAIAEADPDEVNASTSNKRRKSKKKAKQSQELSGSQTESQATPVDNEPAESLSTDDFNATLTRSLAGNGFDPTLLDKALASNESGQTMRDVADDTEDFGFTTTKRKKGKKGRRSQTIGDIRETGDVTAALEDQLLEPSLEAMKPEVETTERQPALDIESGETDNARELSLANATNEDALTAQAKPDQENVTAPVNILTVGRDEMDMDEMDRQYRAYKKKQKKQKAASRASGLTSSSADTASTSAAMSENDALPSHPMIDDRKSASHMDRVELSQPVQSTSAAASVVQSAFPGLERVKRRLPSTSEGPSVPSASSKQSEHIDSYETSRSQTEGRSNDQAQVEELQSRRDFSNERPEARSPQNPDFSADTAMGIGATATIAGAQHMSQLDFRTQPTWGFTSLQDDHQHAPTVTSKASEPIRDSGYQETGQSRQSTQRSSREVPHASSSRESLRERRSLEPLRLATSPTGENEAGATNERESVRTGDRPFERHSRTPSANTPLRPTTAAADISRDQPRSEVNWSDAGDGHVDRLHASQANAIVSQHTIDLPLQSPSNGPLSPRLALDAIPEEHHFGKRSKAPSDVGGPEKIKVVKRGEAPQSIQTEERSLSPSTRPNIAIPSVQGRATSNPLSTDELIHRLSWPAVDEQNDAVNIDRYLGHKYSRPVLPDPRSPSVMSNRSTASNTHYRSPQELRSYSRTSNHSHASTPSLRRTSLSGDLRAASRRGESGSAVGATASPKTIPFEPPPTPPLNDDEIIGSALSRGVDMSDDIFQGYGDAQRSHVSPTRPPSVRKRQSMHITELESKLDQLAAENRALQEARQNTDRGLGAQGEPDSQSLQEALMARDVEMQEKDAEISKIKTLLEPLQEEIARLTEINNGLTESNRNLVDDANGRYATLQAEHTHAHEQWQSATRELETVRSEHGRVASGMKDLIEAEVATALADKNAEILRLREQLDIAAEQIRALQVQMQSLKSVGWLGERDEDYFDGACQKLCQHVQQWVLRFSKLSDNRVCRLSTDLNDDKIEAKLDNATLDGSDVDKLLGDRIRRRDVFMSLVMTMVWEYVFTRYLFGMDREQRQKLKALEKTLAEVGPPRAVAHWRATTLTLLSKRPSFATQCTMDTEAVAHEIFRLLSTLLPPPANAEQPLLASLLRVITIAVNLSIEMRTQRAEYIMLPPLQPEYDMNGDLVRKVHFNASLMNERSGFFSSNEELADEHAVVKIVLFPLVVKKGDDVGEGEEEIVVCPAQVLVQNEGNRGKKVVRVMSGAMEIDDPIRSRQSTRSLISEAPGSVGY